MPNTRHNKYVSVTDWFATPPTSSQTGSVQQSVSRPSPLTGGGGGGNWGSTAVPPSSEGYSLEEIQSIVETYGSSFFLRKDRDDTANGVITFNDLVKSNDFAQGMLMGAGWSIYRDGNNNVVIETDRVIVRKDMTVSELIINQETFLKGSTIYVKAGCTLTDVEDMGTYYRCYYDNKDGNEFSGFVENDLARCQRYDKSYAAVIKYYWRKVVGVGDNYVDLSKIDGEYDGVGIPEEGDDIAQLGNTEDKTRQSAIVISPDSGGSIIIWAGIDSFSLSEKNMVGMGVDPSSGKAYIYGYGDLYFGDRNQEQFINYSPENGLEISGKLSIGTKFGDTTLLEAISAPPEDYDSFKDSIASSLENINVTIDGVTTDLETLQKELDGAIETWFYNGEPTLNNPPANDWTTDELKNTHLGDLYYDGFTGKAYRFQLENSIYVWKQITDTDIQAALKAASQAQDTADKKRRIFITQPYPPYDEGDLWAGGSDTVLKRCINSRTEGVFDEADWDVADKVGVIESAVNEIKDDLTELNDAIEGTKDYINGAFADSIISATEKETIYSYLKQIETTRIEVENSYTELKNNAVLTNESFIESNPNVVSTLNSTYATFNNNCQDLISVIEEVIADDYAEDNEKQRVDAAFELFNTSYGKYIAALNAAIRTVEEWVNTTANNAVNTVNTFNYLKTALGENTSIDGGLILSSLIKLGHTDETGLKKVLSGINGVSNNEDDGIATWWGGDMHDIKDYYYWDGNKWIVRDTSVNIPADMPTGLIRMDGTGYFANGAFWWDKTGKIYADPQALLMSFNVETQDQDLATTIIDIQTKLTYWELKEDANGNKYLATTMPIVTESGITTYADLSDLDLPSIFDSLPIDRDTIYWDNGVLKAKVAEGSITSITKDMVIDALGFTPYDATNPNGYITSAALNGYLPKTGGTIDSGTNWTELYVKSTNASLGLISFGDWAYIQSNQLSFTGVGGTSGYVVSFMFDNIRVGAEGYSVYHSGMIPTIKTHLGLATVATSGSYNDLSNKPTIPTNTNQLTNGAGFITSSALSSYLPLSGGTLTRSDNPPLKINRDSNNSSTIQYAIQGTTVGIMGFDASGVLIVRPNVNSNSVYYKVWHSGNDGSGSGLDADLLDGVQLSGLFTSLSTSVDTNLSITVGGVTKSISNLYAYRTSIFRRTATATPDNTYDLNDHVEGMAYSYSSSSALLNRPSGMSYGQVLALNSSGAKTLCGQLAWDINHASTTDVSRRLWWRAADSTNGFTYSNWHQIAFTDSNVASATKLQTARTIWGQSFDGTGDISGQLSFDSNHYIKTDTSGIFLYNNTSASYIKLYDDKNITLSTGANEANVNISTTADKTTSLNFLNSNVVNWQISSRTSSQDKSLRIYSYDGTSWLAAMTILKSGNIGFGTTTPAYTLDVGGTTRITGAVTIGSTLTGNAWRLGDSSTNPYLRLTRSSVNWYVQLVASGLALGTTLSKSCIIDADGNFLSVGGITQYSDIRKKTKLQDVELTLSQVANAPLIEHYYNSDDKKTTHVGSIAQYWAGMNDWFCKLDSEGYYTMEIQNAALASVISVARELERYESKTDKKIRMLKKRINELEDEIEKLKSA